jgi:hypothetical protein
MRKVIVSGLFGVAVLLSTGCGPDEGIWWSPDGRVAAVRAPDGLRLTDAEGALSVPVVDGEIQSVNWLPDGSALLVSRRYTAEDWNVAEKLIPSEEAAATRQMAAAIPDLLRAALITSGGSLGDIEETFLKPLGLALVGDELESVFRCALALHREKALAAIAGFPESKELETKILGETNAITIHEISLLPFKEGKISGESRAVVRSLHLLADPVISPAGDLLAYVAGRGALKAMTLDGKSSLTVADDNVRLAVWTADGGALVYVMMRDPDESFVGEIRSHKVVREKGTLLSDKNGPRPEPIALATFNLAKGNKQRMRTLPDGRILLATMPLNLPVRVGSISPTGQFFILDVTKADLPLVPVKVTEGSLPADLSAFSVSPDGKWVAVVEAETDVVAVMQLATGKVKMISPARGQKSRLIPAWRNNRELSFAALSGEGVSRTELFIWKADVPARVLSKGWPEEVVKGWLE